jgi:hypothetical protein
MRMTALLLQVSDIKYFTEPSKNKSLNDINNKIRENVLSHIISPPEEYFTDSEYGASWLNIQSKCLSAMGSITSIPHDTIQIKHMGGMSHNYDYEISYLENMVEVDKQKVEFKHNNYDVSKLPQFMELYDRDVANKYEMNDLSYTEFYYNNYIDQYIAIDKNITEPKPELASYIKNVSDIKYDHPFFANLHKNKNNKKTEKRKLANTSMTEYLKIYSDKFKFDKIAQKIQDSQSNKSFLLWDYAAFHVKKLDFDDIIIQGITHVDEAYFDLDVSNFEYNFRVRLNWGNNLGLANPRWKFSFTSK